MTTNVLRGPFLHLLALIALLLPAGCGGGGGGDGGSAGGGAPASEAVTLHYPSGRLEATGFVLAGTRIRTGAWVIYHDVAGSPEQWRGWYRDDAIDTTKPWIEHNVDGSVRYAAGDR
jgi:hypothetical protein